MKKLTELEIAYRKVEWLAQGERQERKRIIKLIEQSKVITADQKFFIIKAIKGEPNE